MSKIEGTCCRVDWSLTPKKCGKPAKVEREGRLYCGIHDPLRAAEKRDTRLAEWIAKAEKGRAEKAAIELQRQKAEAFDWLEAMFKKEREAWPFVRLDPVNLEVVAIADESPVNADDIKAPTLLAAVQAAMGKGK